MHKYQNIILASNSCTRYKMLKNANIHVKAINPNVDELFIKRQCEKDKTPILKIAGILAKHKAISVNYNNRDSMVIGCDQTLIFKNKILSKIHNKKETIERLCLLNNDQHTLLTTCVIYHQNEMIWETTSTARLEMRNNSNDYIKEYVDRNYNEIVNSPGCYMIEKEGVRLFKYIEGDYFSILGMPLVEILNFFNLNGNIK